MAYYRSPMEILTNIFRGSVLPENICIATRLICLVGFLVLKFQFGQICLRLNRAHSCYR
jgi:hypothetical protein